MSCELQIANSQEDRLCHNLYHGGHRDDTEVTEFTLVNQIEEDRVLRVDKNHPVTFVVVVLTIFMLRGERSS